MFSSCVYLCLSDPFYSSLLSESIITSSLYLSIFSENVSSGFNPISSLQSLITPGNLRPPNTSNEPRNPPPNPNSNLRAASVRLSDSIWYMIERQFISCLSSMNCVSASCCSRIYDHPRAPETDRDIPVHLGDNDHKNYLLAAKHTQLVPAQAAKCEDAYQTGILLLWPGNCVT